MNIEVVCFGALRDRLPDPRAGRAQLQVGQDATVGSVATELGIPEGAVFACLLNGEQTDLSHEVTDGDEVTLMPPFAGGR